jgi:hypothetical protein
VVEALYSEGERGFRDLHTFNTAMLAKQCWRMMQDPDSLCARVLRSKYYPDGKLLNAKLKSGSSYTWQSIFYGIQTLRRGCIWRIGEGDQINIWEDVWVPTSPTRKVYTPRGHILLQTVADLINPITGAWNEELLRQIFWPVDVTRILEIPLSPTAEIPSLCHTCCASWQEKIM